MERKHSRFAMLRRFFEPWQWKRKKKSDRFEQTSRTQERKKTMRSTKEELVKKVVLMPDGSDKNQDSKINVFLLNLPDVEESLSVPSFLYVSDSPLVSMKKRNKYRCGQRTVRLAGCRIQSSADNAVFARRRSKSKSELKLWRIKKREKKRERKTEVREQAFPSSHHGNPIVEKLPF
ncbi:phosphatase and actin regulator 2 [Trichonephila clavipes]|uniref:Phosphatase and actin regulator 2 n=1 Tax=Trichonephila clavipes TaxID=2585209 RepID=A0A8X6RRB1_TRICX|nr:phosphatase and actin regulator 2 [Trichonephila clavipes]